MNKRIDLTGRIFGFLAVESLSHLDKNRKSIWNCRCVCGNIRKASTGNLQQGYYSSCGCKNKSTSNLSSGKSLENIVLGSYKYAAKKRNIAWSLEDADAQRLFRLDCFYCGRPPSQIKRKTGCKGEFSYSGIDRLDSSKGYEIDNVVPCCWTCNKAKTDMPYQEFKSWIFRVSDFMSSKAISYAR